MTRKKVEPLGGAKSLEKMVDSGLDAVADLNEVDGSATKAEAAVALMLAGTPYTQIARMLGYTSGLHARNACERVLASSVDNTDLANLREITNRRYSRLLQSVMPKAVDPKDPQHLNYNARAMQLVERIARVNGIDNEIKVNFTPTDEHIAQYIAQVKRVAGEQEEIVEGDIFVETGEYAEPER